MTLPPIARLRRVLTILLIGATSILAGWLLAQRVVIVSGSSMEPGARTGDVVLVWPSATYSVGEAAVFRIPDDQPGAGTRVFHRIVERELDTFVFQGDNNDNVDPWRIESGDIIGRQVLRIPRVGLLVHFLSQPATIAALVAGLTTATLLSRSQPARGTEARHRRRASGSRSQPRRRSAAAVEMRCEDRTELLEAADRVPQMNASLGPDRSAFDPLEH